MNNRTEQAGADIDISVIIVNYKSRAFTQACLRSIQSSSFKCSIEIVVIDNASQDGCKEMVEAEFPAVMFVESKDNLGFARANNLGAQLARGKYALFLNPDTEVQKLAIQELYDSLGTLPDAGMVGARLLNSDGSIQTTSITAFPTILNQVFGVERIRQKYPRLPLWGIRALFEKCEAPVRVEAISGACMLVSREVFQRVGGFTTEYFMYAEDLDLCWKIRKSGRAVYYVPNAIVVHHGGQSSSSRSESNYADLMIKESMWKFMRLRYNRCYAGAFRVATGLASFCRLMLLSGMALVPNGVVSKAAVAKARRKWSVIFFWCLGRSPVAAS